MNKLSIFKIGFILFMVGIIVLTGCQDSTEVSKNEESDSENISKKEEVKDGKESNLEELDNITSTLDRTFIEIGEKGKECKAIEETIERGDCFQSVNSSKLSWYIDESKETFFFDFQMEPDVREDIMFFTIDDMDRLSEAQKTDYYDVYLDKGYNEDHIEYGKEKVNEYWHIFSNIIPKEYRQDLTTIYWRDTGGDYIFQAGRNPENVKDMGFVLSHNITNYASNSRNVLIHEFAHILTLNETQVKVDPELYHLEDDTAWEALEAECSVLFNWSCMEGNSYLNQFYQEFWKDIESDYEEIDWESENGYKDFFLKYEDRFFNTYQGTTPIEDIADAFTNFVMINSEDLEDKPEMKYSKVKFFYEYDELVELRTMILENINDLVVEDREFY